MRAGMLETSNQIDWSEERKSSTEAQWKIRKCLHIDTGLNICAKLLKLEKSQRWLETDGYRRNRISNPVGRINFHRRNELGRMSELQVLDEQDT